MTFAARANTGDVPELFAHLSDDIMKRALVYKPNDPILFCTAQQRFRIIPVFGDRCDEDGLLSTSRRAIGQRFAGHGMRAAFSVCDKQSARTADERPQFQRMLAYCRKFHKNISCVVVSDLSRFARNVADQGASIAELKRLGIKTISVDEPMVDGTSAGKLAANMLGAFNQYFSDSLSEKTKFRMQAAVKAGRFVWRAPIGYTNPKAGAGSTIKIDAERAPLIRKGFELMSSGNHHADDVLRTITALGLRTTRGAKLPRQTWHSVLRNPLYAGWVKSVDLQVRGTHPPIVTQQLFDRVQEVLSCDDQGLNFLPHTRDL